MASTSWHSPTLVRCLPGALVRMDNWVLVKQSELLYMYCSNELMFIGGHFSGGSVGGMERFSLSSLDYIKSQYHFCVPYRLASSIVSAFSSVVLAKLCSLYLSPPSLSFSFQESASSNCCVSTIRQRCGVPGSWWQSLCSSYWGGCPLHMGQRKLWKTGTRYSCNSLFQFCCHNDILNQSKCQSG